MPEDEKKVNPPKKQQPKIVEKKIEPEKDDDFDAEENYSFIQNLIAEKGYDDALLHLAKQNENYPFHIESHILNVLVTTEVGKYEEALASARRAVFLAKDAPYPLFVMANALYKTGAKAQARIKYEQTEKLLSKLNKFQYLQYVDDLTVHQLRELLYARKKKKLPMEKY